MSENFAQMLEESIKDNQLAVGSIVKGHIINIDSDYVTVDVGLKSEGVIPINQFKSVSGELDNISVGMEVDVYLESVEDGWGETKLSREKAKRQEVWDKLAEISENNETVVGLVSGKVKGGFTVVLQGLKAFLPGSLVDSKAGKENVDLEGQELEFKVIKLEQKRNNIVVSRRSLTDSDSSKEREELLNSIQEGQEITGVVKNLTDYGAFVDLGGIDGLLHITDMAWKRVKHPSEVVEAGQELKVKVLKFDKEKARVSLGIKQLGADPWSEIKARYPEKTRFTGKVTNVTDYGCFVELEEGVEGLVHVSEMDWTNKNIHPSKVVKLGMDVEVIVLEIDEERRRISLGIKQCQANPWDDFSSKHAKGDIIKGNIRSITDFGIFIGLEGNIDGLIHLSDISWEEPSEEIIRNYKKGQEVEAKILAIDSERERISLGVKQLESDQFGDYIGENGKGSIVEGTVSAVDEKGAMVTLAEEVEGYLKASEISRDKVNDASAHLKVGDKVEAKIITIEKKSRTIMLSIKAKDAQEEKAALKELSKNANEGNSTTLGDIFKQQMSDNSDSNS